jgi:hypothetical protein
MQHSGSVVVGGAVHKKPRLVFTDIQRRTLLAIFKETRRPNKDMQATIAEQLGLKVSTVANFFMNARRRSLDKYLDDGASAGGGSSATGSSTGSGGGGRNGLGHQSSHQHQQQQQHHGSLVGGIDSENNGGGGGGGGMGR